MLIQAIVAQVVLHRQGRDPDVTDFNLDMAEIYKAFGNREEMDHMQQTIRELSSQVRSRFVPYKHILCTALIVAVYCLAILVVAAGRFTKRLIGRGERRERQKDGAH